VLLVFASKPCLIQQLGSIAAMDDYRASDKLRVHAGTLEHDAVTCMIEPSSMMHARSPVNKLFNYSRPQQHSNVN
jgi:hypothetical protein